MDKNKKEELEKEETALEQIEPELEETESYKKASFGEKISLKLRKRVIASRFHTFIVVLFLIIVVWGINVWAESKKLAQIDVTKNHLYSLTETSKDQLKNLKKEIKIYAYGYTENDSLIQFLQQYNAFNKKITYEIITESTNYEIVTKYGLGALNALIVTCGEKDRTIYPDYEFSSYDSNTGDTVDVAEETITNAILKVSTDDPIKLYFATGNGEYSSETVSQLVSYLEEEVYEIEDLNLLTITEIPADCDVLAILSPEEDLTETQADLIKNYALNGGNLLICSLVPNEKEFTNLQSILNLYGVTINKGLLYEGNSNNYLAYQNTVPLPYILIPIYSTANSITAEFASANNTQMMIMPWSQSLTIKDVEEENVTVAASEIITTSASCYNIPDYTQGISNSVLEGLEKSTYIIGAEFTRTTKTEESTTESKLVIYANTTFFTNTYKDANVQMSIMKNPGNVNLILNTFAELAEEENLITVRKAANITEFHNTEAETRIVKLIIFGIPALIIVIGIMVWNHRKKKR